MAEESTTPEVPTSEWGLPLDWDGHERNPYPFFVEDTLLIPKMGWDYIHQSSNTAWVIIPTRSRNANHNHG